MTSSIDCLPPSIARLLATAAAAAANPKLISSSISSSIGGCCCLTCQAQKLLTLNTPVDWWGFVVGRPTNILSMIHSLSFYYNPNENVGIGVTKIRCSSMHLASYTHGQLTRLMGRNQPLVTVELVEFEK